MQAFNNVCLFCELVLMHDARMPYVLWPDADAISLLAMHHLTHRVRKDEQVCQ